MDDAPKGALYLWPVSDSRGYAKALAHHLGRRDLVIVTPDELNWLDYRYRARKQSELPALVVDHATYELMALRYYDALERLRFCLERGSQRV